MDMEEFIQIYGPTWGSCQPWTDAVGGEQGLQSRKTQNACHIGNGSPVWGQRKTGVLPYAWSWCTYCGRGELNTPWDPPLWPVLALLSYSSITQPTLTSIPPLWKCEKWRVNMDSAFCVLSPLDGTIRLIVYTLQGFVAGLSGRKNPNFSYCSFVYPAGVQDLGKQVVSLFLRMILEGTE